jgi:hypothetical protein
MNKQQKYLFMAILIPILMILIIAFSLLIPVKKITPMYNFLYAIGDSSESFTCLQNTMAKFFPKTVNIDFYKVEPGSCKKVRLFVYDFNNDSTQPIAFEDAKKLHLKQNLTSDSENFYVSRDCYTGPDLGLWSMRSTYNDVCLVKGDYKRLLNVYPEHTSGFYFISIGWILPKASANLETKS